MKWFGLHLQGAMGHLQVKSAIKNLIVQTHLPLEYRLLNFLGLWGVWLLFSPPDRIGEAIIVSLYNHFFAE